MAARGDPGCLIQPDPLPKSAGLSLDSKYDLPYIFAHKPAFGRNLL
jgi:hypothetical protein